MILVVGLAPVWQRTVFFDRLKLGEVNRARKALENASGKSANVARILTQLGAPARVLTVAGGLRGRAFCAGLRRDGVAARIIEIAGETRVCQTVIAGRPGAGRAVVTELVEEAPGLSRVELAAVMRAFQQELERATLLALSGSVPPGCGPEFYARLARLAARRGVPVLMDTQGAQLLNAVATRPLLVKINRAELAAATGARERREGVRRLQARGAGQVAITHGAGVVWAFDGERRFSVRPPTVTAVNPIGSGDALLAGMAAVLARGGDWREALRWGVACGAANALTETAGMLELRTVRRLLQQMLDR